MGFLFFVFFFPVGFLKQFQVPFSFYKLNSLTWVLFFYSFFMFNLVSSLNFPCSSYSFIFLMDTDKHLSSRKEKALTLQWMTHRSLCWAINLYPELRGKENPHTHTQKLSRKQFIHSQQLFYLLNTFYWVFPRPLKI